MTEVSLSRILEQLTLNGNRGTQQELFVSTSFIRNRSISTGIPNLEVWCKKWSNWTSGIGVGQKIQPWLL